MDTLVLCSAYQPLRKVSWQRAMEMWFAGRVEILVEYSDRVIRTVDEAVPMPAVVRVVTGYVKKLFRARVPCTKENIWTRDKHRCQYCGNVVTKKDRTLDHVLPKSRGGGRSWENLVTSCVTCNGTKGDRTPEEAGMRLLSTPAAPGKSYRQDRLTWSAIRSSPWAEAIRGSGLLGTE